MADRVGQGGDRVLLGEEAPHPGGQGAFQDGVGDEGGQDEDAELGALPVEDLRQRDAVDARHLDVEEEHLDGGAPRAQTIEDLLPVPGGPGDAYVLGRIEDIGEGAANEGIVVGEPDIDHRGHAVLFSGAGCDEARGTVAATIQEPSSARVVRVPSIAARRSRMPRIPVPGGATGTGDAVGGHEPEDIGAKSEGQRDGGLAVGVTDDVGPHLTGRPGHGARLEATGDLLADAAEDDVEARGGDVVAHGPDGGVEVHDGMTQAGGRRHRRALRGSRLAQGAQQQAQLVERVGGRRDHGRELLPRLRRVGGVGGGPPGAQGGLRHGVGDQVVHLPRDLQAHLLQLLAGSADLPPPGDLGGAQGHSDRQQQEAHEQVGGQSADTVGVNLGCR